MLCDNLTDRKQLMMDQSDVFIALPGGIGTLDEVFTVAASATIGYHHKRVVLYNMKGFWDGAIRMLDDLQAKGVIRGSWQTQIAVANNLDEIAVKRGGKCFFINRNNKPIDLIEALTKTISL